MPRVDDLIDQLGKPKFITTLDLSCGYWQVPVEKTSHPKTAFTTPFGLFQFRVMPFGLHGAPAAFQRMMDEILRDLGSFAAAYLDDVVIHSTTWQEHLQHIRAVMNKLQDAGLTVKPKKCQFATACCTYLGHVVGNGDVCPKQSKLQAVEQFPVPSTKRQVRAFLGLTGYYRKFILDYATVAAPPTDLTKKCAPSHVAWSVACSSSFDQLKKHLCSFPVPKSPNFNQQFILHTDASDRALVLFLVSLVRMEVSIQ